MLNISFRFVEKPMSWHESADYCKKMGAKLIEIDSEDENTAIVAEITRRGYSRGKSSWDKKMFFWIGMTDLDEEGTWKLASSDKKASYLNWASNRGSNPEPNNWKWNEHCAHLRTSGCLDWDQSAWADYDCSKIELEITCTNNGYRETAHYSMNALCEFETKSGEILKVAN